jgi:ABC-type multidrug transport system ATPase subunit
MSDALWRLEGVWLDGRAAPRLADVTLDVRPGITAVLGCSGAGKTSLLNLLVGFEQPDRGTAFASLPQGGHALPLFWVPQEGGLWPHLTAAEHLAAVLPPGAPPGRLEALLGAFGLSALAGARPEQLSMGERSRLAMARALAADAAVLVMDEPLLHVDRVRAGECWAAVRREAAAGGQALVYSTHSPEAVVGEADRVVCLKAGRALCEGTVDEVYWNPASREEAECLGEVNWLPPAEADGWVAGADGHPACYRPEQLAIAPAADGPLVVRSHRFRGAVAEAELEHRGSGEVRRFYHRPAGRMLRAGDRVVLKALALLLVALIAGCGGRGEPALSVKSVEHWSVPAEGPTIPAPRSVAVGAGDEVYVLDTAGRVLVFSPDGALVRQWRMPDVAVGKPEGIRVLKDGRVAVCDTHYCRVLVFDSRGTRLSEFGRQGRGPGEFIYPVGIAEDDAGFLYVCEYGGNDRVQKFTADGRHVLSFGSFGTGEGQFQRPSGMAWLDGRLYVADAINNRILSFDAEGRYCGVLGEPGGRLTLRFPYDIAAGPDAALYVVEYGAGRLTKLSLTGRLLGRYGAAGRGLGELQTPWGLAVDSHLRLHIADTGNRRIVGLRL